MKKLRDEGEDITDGSDNSEDEALIDWKLNPSRKRKRGPAQGPNKRKAVKKSTNQIRRETIEIGSSSSSSTSDNDSESETVQIDAKNNATKIKDIDKLKEILYGGHSDAPDEDDIEIVEEVSVTKPFKLKNSVTGRVTTMKVGPLPSGVAEAPLVQNNDEDSGMPKILSAVSLSQFAASSLFHEDNNSESSPAPSNHEQDVVDLCDSD